MHASLLLGLVEFIFPKGSTVKAKVRKNKKLRGSWDLGLEILHMLIYMTQVEAS